MAGKADAQAIMVMLTAAKVARVPEGLVWTKLQELDMTAFLSFEGI
jgi:hypothetical protein